MTSERDTPGIAVEVDGQAWTRVASLRHAGPDERVFTVTREDDGTAEVRFGDGQRGQRPHAGSIVKVTYSTGGGTIGSVSRRIEDARIEPRFWMISEAGAGAVGWQTVERKWGRAAVSAITLALGLALALVPMLGLGRRDRAEP